MMYLFVETGGVLFSKCFLSFQLISLSLSLFTINDNVKLLPYCCYIYYTSYYILSRSHSAVSMHRHCCASLIWTGIHGARFKSYLLKVATDRSNFADTVKEIFLKPKSSKLKMIPFRLELQLSPGITLGYAVITSRP